MNALTTVEGDVVNHPAEVRTPAEDAFTDAIMALSKLYDLALQSNIESLKRRTEAATRELVGWHHDDKPRVRNQRACTLLGVHAPEPLDAEPCRIIRGHTLVNFPPQEEATK